MAALSPGDLVVAGWNVPVWAAPGDYSRQAANLPKGTVALVVATHKCLESSTPERKQWQLWIMVLSDQVTGWMLESSVNLI